MSQPRAPLRPKPAHTLPDPNPATPRVPGQSTDNPAPPTRNGSERSARPNPAARKKTSLAARRETHRENAPHVHPVLRHVLRPPLQSAELSCRSENRKKSRSNSIPPRRTQLLPKATLFHPSEFARA